MKAVKFEELKSLDLRACATVGDIVQGLRYCAFGGRMLGEVANTIYEMATAKKKPLIIFDGLADSPLGALLKQFVAHGWCRRVLLPAQYARGKFSGVNVIVVGAFSERDAAAIYAKPARAIFINPFDMARPGQIRDGFFPDAVFADPRYVMPLIYAVLGEWIGGKPSSVAAFISQLAPMGGLAAQVARGASGARGDDAR